MKRYLLCAAAAALASAPLVARAESKIAVIEMARAIAETNEGGRATLTLKSLFDKRQVDLDGKQTGLLKERTELEKRCKAGLGKAECDRGQEEIQKKLFDLQQLLMQYQGEIQKKQAEATQPMFQKMSRIVERLAKQKGFEVVVDKQAALHFKPELDLTELAITTYNADTPGVAPLTAQEKAQLAAMPPPGTPPPPPDPKAAKKAPPAAPKKK
ncbi:MAG: OmpH family outer membrane protein [Polyangiaceae bacterium]|nr:OmpH family outer membrane protein [Polyangiaceae bacterium]